MMFVWKTTCRRLQSSGALARFAEGVLSAQERHEIDTHIAECPVCRTVAADASAVARLLRANPPAAPSTGLAASGNLWATLEAEIAHTPQEMPLSVPDSSPASVSAPRLQRFGHWLATPGALPFGSVAAAAVVGMVGIAVYQRTGAISVSPAPAVTAMEDSNLTEINIIPSPRSPVPSAPAARRMTATRSAPASTAAAASSENYLALAPIESKLSVRRSEAKSSTASGRRPLSMATQHPAPTRPRTFQMVAKASESDFSSSAVPSLSFAPPPAPAAPASGAASGMANEQLANGGNGGGLAGGALRKDEDMALSLAPSASARAMVVPAPASVAAITGRSEKSESRDYLRDAAEDVPAVRSLLDMALQQRRQRSLFSYAIR